MEVTAIVSATAAMRQRRNFDFSGARGAFFKDQILIKGKSGVGRAAIKRRVAARIKIGDNARSLKF